MPKKVLLQFVNTYRFITDNRQQKFVLGIINPELAEVILDLTGKNILGFSRIVDNFGIKHAFKKHGNQEVENLRGQIPISPDDFELIYITVIFFDQITVETGKKGLITIKYEKKFDDFLLVYAEEIRVGKQELAFLTLYKRKIRKL